VRSENGPERTSERELFLISLLSDSVTIAGKITPSPCPLCNRPIKRNSAPMFFVPFSNPNDSPNLNPNLNSEPSFNPGTDPGFGTEEILNRVEGAGLDTREQKPLPLPDRDNGNLVQSILQHLY
jgi:hypothetical protein